jgi:hypothetical protein
MINDFGAAIPEESAGQIVTYLQAHYPPGKPRAVSRLTRGSPRGMAGG